MPTDACRGNREVAARVTGLFRELKLCLADALESGGGERSGVDETAEPAEAGQGVGLVIEAADRREDAPVEEVPLLDLVEVSFDVPAKALQVCAKPFLHGLEPRLARITRRVDAAQLE